MQRPLDRHEDRREWRDRIRVLDQRGRAVTGGTWTVNAPLVAEIVVADGAIRVQALASGEATLTLTRDGLSASVNDRPTTVRAMTFDGQQLWSRRFAGEAMIKDVAADSHGGVILVLTDTFDTDGLPQRVQRIDGATGKVSWQYFAPDDGSLSEVAVHPTGTVFVSTEGYYYPDVTYLVALDGETGASKRWRLANGSAPTGPVVRDDGSVVALFNPADDSGHRHLQLVTVKDPTGPASFTDLYLAAPQYPFYPDRYRLIPHDDALLLAQTRNGTDLMRIAANGTVSPVTTLLPPVSGRTVAQVDYAVGGSTGMAIIRRDSGQYQTPYNVYTATFDPVTLSGGAMSAGTDPYATYRFITADGGVHVSGEMGGRFGSNDNQVARGLWATLGATASLRQGPWVDVAPASGFVSGGAVSTNSPAKKRIRAIIAFSSQLGLPAQDKQPCDPLDRFCDNTLTTAEQKTSFTDAEIASIKNVARWRTEQAYLPYDVDVRVEEFNSSWFPCPIFRDINCIFVVPGQPSEGGASTYGRTQVASSVYLGPLLSTMLFLSPPCEFQDGLGDCAARPGAKDRAALITGLAWGIGATAAHELAHQFSAIPVVNGQHPSGVNIYDSSSVLPANFFGQLTWSGDTGKELKARLLPRPQ